MAADERFSSPMPFGVQPVHGIPISSFVESTYPVVSNAFRRSAGSRPAAAMVRSECSDASLQCLSAFSRFTAFLFHPSSSRLTRSSPMPFGVQPVHGAE